MSFAHSHTVKIPKSGTRGVGGSRPLPFSWEILFVTAVCTYFPKPRRSTSLEMIKILPDGAFIQPSVPCPSKSSVAPLLPNRCTRVEPMKRKKFERYHDLKMALKRIRKYKEAVFIPIIHGTFEIVGTNFENYLAKFGLEFEFSHKKACLL